MKASLNFHSIQFWREPLPRELVKQTMKLSHDKITLDGKTWKIENSPFTVTNQTRLSNIRWAWQVCLHYLKMAFGCYRKKFKNAVLHIENLQIQSKAAKEAEKVKALNSAITKQKSMKICEEHLKLARQEEARRLAKLDQFKLNHENKVKQKKEEIEHSRELCTLLENFKEAQKKNANTFTFNLKPKKNTQYQLAIEKLKKIKDFAGVSFETIKSDELDQMITHQKNQFTESSENLKTKEKDYEKNLPLKEKKVDEAVRDVAKFSGMLESQLKDFCSLPTWIQRKLNPPKFDSVSSKVPYSQRAVLFDKTTRLVGPERGFIKTLKNFNQELGEIWEILFLNFKQTLQCDLVKVFTKTKEGYYKLTLHEPLRIWMHSTNDKNVEDPPGGVVFHLGSNKNKEVFFTLKNQTIFFEKGFTIVIKTPIWAKTLIWKAPSQLETTVKSQQFKDRNEIILTASYGGFSRPRTKTFNDLKENWAKRNVITDSTKSDAEIINSHLNAKKSA